MSKKISCGGFYIDENDFNIDEEGKLSLKQDGGDPGYTVTEERVVVIPEQTVTTNGSAPDITAYLNIVDGATAPDSMTVTFNGTDYECKRVYSPEVDGDIYGATLSGFSIDFSDYPFLIAWTSDVIQIITESPATVTVVGVGTVKKYNLSDDFVAAANIAVPVKPIFVDLEEYSGDTYDYYNPDVKFRDLYNAISDGGDVFIRIYGTGLYARPTTIARSTFVVLFTTGSSAELYEYIVSGDGKYGPVCVKQKRYTLTPAT